MWILEKENSLDMTACGHFFYRSRSSNRNKIWRFTGYVSEMRIQYLQMSTREPPACRRCVSSGGCSCGSNTIPAGSITQPRHSVIVFVIIRITAQITEFFSSNQARPKSSVWGHLYQHKIRNIF